VVSPPDPYPSEERVQSIGTIGQIVILVIHTSLEPDFNNGEEIGRIISARKATSRERQAYEDGDF
jgi:uncharacterized protein